MPYFKMPVSWSMYGYIDVEAKDKEEFKKLVEKYREDDSNLGLPDDKYYIDGSFEIADDDFIEEFNKNIDDGGVKLS